MGIRSILSGGNWYAKFLPGGAECTVPLSLTLAGLLLLCVGCSAKPHDLGGCWSAENLPLNSQVAGNVIILASEFANETAYPVDCEGAGVNLIMPKGYDILAMPKRDLGKPWMGGYFFAAHIVGKTDDKLTNGRPRLSIVSISQVRSTERPRWINSDS